MSILFFNIATQAVHHYQPPNSQLTDNFASTTVTVNSDFVSGNKVGATSTGGLVSAYVAYEISNCMQFSQNCSFGIFSKLYGVIGWVLFVVSQVDGNTGVKVNLTYHF